jgi:hypothetical protein
MNFKKWVKSMQTAGYNGAHTVYVFLKLHFMQLFSADATYNTIFSKNKKLPSKVAHNPTRQRDFSLAIFCFVQLRHNLNSFLV